MIASPNYVGDEETEANANLIKAAPELLAELQFAVKLLKPWCGELQFREKFRRMEAVIAKATGAQS